MYSYSFQVVCVTSAEQHLSHCLSTKVNPFCYKIVIRIELVLTQYFTDFSGL